MTFYPSEQFQEDEICKTLIISLGDSFKNEHNLGTFELSDQKVNGKPCWISKEQNKAIWSSYIFRNNEWVIGKTEEMSWLNPNV